MLTVFVGSSIVRVPLFERLENNHRILVAGCGGGFDVYCGLPIAMALWRMGKEVVLGNLTFATAELRGRRSHLRCADSH